MKIIQKTTLWRGLTAIFAFFLVVTIMASNLALQYDALISLHIKAPTYKSVDAETELDSNQYIKSSYGEVSDTTLVQLISDSYQQVINEEEEGAVLLKNENKALPLDTSKENRITFFGRAVVDPLYTNSGSQSFIISQSPELCVTPYEAFTNAGFEINDTLYNAYEDSPTKRSIPHHGEGVMDIGEEKASFYTDTIKDSWENDYNDTAVIMLSRYGGEGVDMPTHAIDDDGSEMSQLSLFKSERDMLQMIKDSNKFGKVIVLLNSPYQMEVDWLDEYGVEACLWIACPGVTGFTGVANIISGKVNPSGRLSDTYAISSLSSPAIVNAIDNTGMYANGDEVEEYTAGDEESSTTYMGYIDYTVQLENIYFGYKYYETRYEDCILNQGGANSTKGSIDGQNWNYAKEIAYPFGYGLSYTTFSQELTDVTYDSFTDKYTLEVNVVNTGEVEGKSVVQVYVQTPYEDYEKENSVEKSSINLVGFGKTMSLKKGESETVIVEVDRYLLTSYDENNAKGYILSKGDYFLAIGDNVHDALNNILAAKGASGMFDIDGYLVSGNENKTYHFNMNEIDTQTYKKSKTGVTVTNQFDDCDINYWNTTQVTYLSRRDWDSTYPTQAPNIVCTEDMMKILNNELYTKPDDAPLVESFEQGVESGITFVMMKDVPYDDPMWETYLNQFTLEELAANATDNFGIPGNTSVAKPATAIGDGTNGFRGTFSYGDKRYSCQYASSGILASTFNKELMQTRAKLFVEESLFSGSAFEASAGAPIAFGTNIGANLHRTPFGGRASEYLSECPDFTALIGEIMSNEMTSRGYAGGPKHFVGNDQETSRGGVSMFFTEQSFREGALRGFEGCLSWGDSMYTMQSMGRVGLYYISASNALNTQVLRNEWGFEGFVMTDGVLSPYGQEYLSQLTAGTDNICLSCRLDFDAETGVSLPGHQYITAIKEGDGYILQRLRQMAKNIDYTLAQTLAVNGLRSSTKMISITPWWKIAMYATNIIIAMFTLIFLGILVFSEKFSKKKDNHI